MSQLPTRRPRPISDIERENEALRAERDALRAAFARGHQCAVIRGVNVWWDEPDWEKLQALLGNG